MRTVKMDKLTQFKLFEVWAPRWHDEKVLLKASKVGAHNKILFTKTPTLPEMYYLSGKTVKKYRKESNGRIDCYAVPMKELQILQLTENSQFEI